MRTVAITVLVLVLWLLADIPVAVVLARLFARRTPEAEIADPLQLRRPAASRAHRLRAMRGHLRGLAVSSLVLAGALTVTVGTGAAVLSLPATTPTAIARVIEAVTPFSIGPAEDTGPARPSSAAPRTTAADPSPPAHPPQTGALPSPPPGPERAATVASPAPVPAAAAPPVAPAVCEPPAPSAEGSPSPSPAGSAAPTATPTVLASPTGSASPAPSASPSGSVTPSPSPSASGTAPQPSGSASPAPAAGSAVTAPTGSPSPSACVAASPVPAPAGD